LAKATTRKLKVFQAQLGFYDSVVAAASQAAALRAWGVHQNLFADGQAKITTDPQAVDAALAHPDTPLRRGVGSSDAFALEPASLPKLPAGAKKPAAKSAAKPAKSAKPEPAPKPPPRPVADRTALDVAEAALRKLEQDRKRDEAALRQQQDELDAARKAAQTTYTVDRKAAMAAIASARKTYTQAGGVP
jgi:hypothetical protein